MSNVKEISRRVMYHEDGGMACGPIFISAVHAEILLDNDGKKEYIYGEWVSEAGDDILYQVSEKSFYDIFERIYKAKSRKEEDRILADRDKIPCTEPDEDDPVYKPFMGELKKMIIREMEEHGLEPYFDEDEDWDEDED